MKRKSDLNRRQLLGKAIANGIGGMLILGGCRSAEMRETVSSKPPNIILLLTDDQRWDALGCMGNSIIKTPNINKMAENSVLFRNAFVTTSICCSSRASIFSGQYLRRHGINDFKTDFSGAALNMTYPMLLKQAGYRTGFVGKYGVGVNLPTDKFDFWRGFGGWGKYEQKDENGNYKHLTKIVGEESLEFLQNCRKDKPFCLSVSFKAPHNQYGDPRQFIYDPAYENLYKNVTIPTPETARQRYFNALPGFLQTSESRTRWQRRFATQQMFQEKSKGYYRLITGVDTVVGQIRDELRKSGLENNTVIIYTSDNGFFLGEHGLAGKWFPYEESIRVPLIIYDPRVPAMRQRRERPEMVLNIDIAPTILSMAGVNVPETMQGKDMTALLGNRIIKWRKDFLYEHLFAYEGKIPQSEGVVTEEYKYIRYIEQKPPYEELFHLKKDPHETVNLAKKPAYHNILVSLRQRCDELILNAK